MKSAGAGTRRTEMLMGTVVTIEVVADGAGDAIDDAMDWFRRVEAVCSRFNPDSELTRLTRQVGTAVEVSPMLFEALQFATAVAGATGGAFDPTVGADMEQRGFDREYSSGLARRHAGAIPETTGATFRDVRLDPAARTVTLLRPLLLDLGAVAKGLAVDIAARELEALHDFVIDAGGDLYVAGRNPAGEPWSVGIRHPRLHDRMIETIRVSDCAVCTSGDYERRGASGETHILDPREPCSTAAGRAPAAGGATEDVASVTVIARTAMLADALATAAFVLGPDEGLALLAREQVEGVMYTTGMDRRATAGVSHA